MLDTKAQRRGNPAEVGCCQCRTRAAAIEPKAKPEKSERIVEVSICLYNSYFSNLALILEALRISF